MSETKRRGTPRPGNGGERTGAGRKTNAAKGLPPARSVVLRVSVEPDLAEWLKANGGPDLHYYILSHAFVKALIV